MSRLANVANLGFVAIPPVVTKLIATYVGLPETRNSLRVSDLCAGEGAAAHDYMQAWGLDTHNMYLNEIHPDRFITIKQRFIGGNLLNCDTLSDLQVPRGAFQVAYSNPPFMWQGKEAGGTLDPGEWKEADRIENLFWERIIRDRGWLQPAGIAILVAPDHVFRRIRTINLIAKFMDKVVVRSFPEDVRKFNEWVLIGQRSKVERVTSYLETVAQLKESWAREKPPLEAQAEPMFQVPMPQPIAHFYWRCPSDSTAEQAQRDVLAEGGAWVSGGRQDKQRLISTTQLSTIMPMYKRQGMLRVADGAINGAVIDIEGVPHRIKGSTVKVLKESAVDKSNEDRQVTEKHAKMLSTPQVVTMAPDGLMTRYVDNAGIQALTQDEATTEALLAEVRKTVAERYTMHPPDDVAKVLANITPSSGRKLPGQEFSGMMPMQQHVAAAAFMALTTRDESWDAQPRAMIIAAEMGCGKTLLAIAMAMLFDQLRQTRTLTKKRRAARVVFTAPNHLIGERSQVEAARKGKGEYPPHWAEFADFTRNGWYMEILESPHQVTRFFQHADMYPAMPHVAFITNSRLSLDSGSAPGILDERVIEDDGEALARMSERQRRINELRERLSHRDWNIGRGTRLAAQVKAIRADERRTRKVVKDLGFQPESYKDEKQVKGDERAKYPIPIGGLICPECGRRVYTKDSDPEIADLKDLDRTPGIRQIKCDLCGGNLGRHARRWDNTVDRKLSVFKVSPTNVPMTEMRRWVIKDSWQQRTYYGAGTLEPRPPIGTQTLALGGERPTSNPRMSLANFIAKRHRGDIDLYVADEVHEMKGVDSAVGDAFGKMVSSSRRTVALTGTIYGGKASDVFRLLFRLGCKPLILEYGWNGLARFTDKNGVIDVVTRISKPTETTGMGSGKTTVNVTRKELPGITAGLAAIIQNVSIQVLLKNMGFVLPPYTEEPVLLEMPEEIAKEYRQLDAESRSIIRKGKDALSRYLQSTLTYPYMPWHPVRVWSKYLDLEGYLPEAMPASMVLPHHRWLAEYCAAQISQGYRCLLYCEHTLTLDITPDLAEKVSRLALEEHGVDLKFAILRSTTCKPGERMEWFNAREKDGTNVVICHPKLVKTGLNLPRWMKIVVVEAPYSLFTLAQAKKRAYRPTQTVACDVTFLAYAGTMSAAATSIVARKSAAAAILSGDDLDAGLMEFDDSMSLFQQLAGAVKGEDTTVTMTDLRAQFQRASQAMVDANTSTAADFGVQAEVMHIINQHRKTTRRVVNLEEWAASVPRRRGRDIPVLVSRRRVAGPATSTAALDEHGQLALFATGD